MKDEVQKLLKEISEKLSVLIKLLVVKEEWSIRDKIKFLSKFEISNREIAKILNISETYVAKEKSLLKKEDKNE
ncbi:MAG: hypothetical protein QXM11_02025 [Candidatus Aenigmatarchaeota archaeon]